LIHRYEQRHACQHLRPPGATAYRAASFFTGAGIMDEAARKAKFVVVCCAEIDESLHEAYYDNTGVQPYPSNEALIQKIPEDLDMVMFGSSCRSIARPGLKRGLDAREDWKEFDRVVEYLGTSNVLQCTYEMVSDLLEDPACSSVKDHVFRKFDEAGYTIKYGVVDPWDFGWGASRRRALVLAMKKEAAALVGFTSQPVVSSGPIGQYHRTKRCTADYMDQPRSQTPDDDVVVFDDWQRDRWEKHQERWEIRWLPGYETAGQRKAIRRDETLARGKPLTLGYACRVGEPLCTYTGHKVGSVYGPLHGITASGIATGPGKNSPMYYDPVSERISTLGARTISKIWDLGQMKGMSVAAIGQSAHPVPMTANFITQALYLDKYYFMTRSVPRVPLIEFKRLTDVLEGTGIYKIKTWVSRVEGWTKWLRRNPTQRRRSPPPAGTRRSRRLLLGTRLAV
jgi:site-specific DNA-cytosine methylase